MGGLMFGYDWVVIGGAQPFYEKYFRLASFTFLAIRTVDAWDRKVLMLAGAAGLAVCYGLLGLGYRLHVTGIPMLALVLSAIAVYACTLAPVTWVLISEIFPNRIRGASVSAAVFSLWLACFILTVTFPLLNRTFGASSTFWIHAAVCAFGFTVITRLPETKGKTLERIEKEPVRQTQSWKPASARSPKSRSGNPSDNAKGLR